MDKPELDAMVEEAMGSFWAQGSMTYEEGRKLLHDLVSKATARKCSDFREHLPPCPEGKHQCGICRLHVEVERLKGLVDDAGRETLEHMALSLWDAEESRDMNRFALDELKKQAATATSEVPCPECGGAGDFPDLAIIDSEGHPQYPICQTCKGTGTVPLAVRDRWVAEQVIEEACASEVSTEHGPYANVAELRVDLDKWADGRFSENAHD